MSTASINAASIEVLPAESWAYDQMHDDYKAAHIIWREVSADFYDQALNVLPPLDWSGQSFLVGEAYTHCARGAVYAGLTKIEGRYYARYVARKDFRDELNKLRAHLIMPNLMPHTVAALAEYEKTQPARQALWDAAETNEDVAACEAADLEALNLMRVAYYEDTKGINRLDNCMLLSDSDICRVVGRVKA